MSRPKGVAVENFHALAISDASFWLDLGQSAPVDILIHTVFFLILKYALYYSSSTGYARIFMEHISGLRSWTGRPPHVLISQMGANHRDLQKVCGAN